MSLFGVGVLGVSPAHAYTVTRYPTSCFEYNVGGSSWSNINNVKASDNAYAAATIGSGGFTNGLICTGYGFFLPSTATVTGVRVDVERNSNGGNTYDGGVRLVKAGGVGNTDRLSSDAYTSSDVVDKKHGSTTDLWGTTWTPADINNAGFGTGFAALVPGGSPVGSRVVSVDSLAITVSYEVPFSCAPPANTPAGVSLTCVCDTFKRTTLNPSPIFSSNWIVSTSDSTNILPSIVNSGFLRLTNNTGNNAKAATLPAAFPAAGNYISVEFEHFSYGGVPYYFPDHGADGMAITLSDYSVPAVPGAYGGSLGYAQKTGIAGFAGGWLGVGLDEFGNFQNEGEGRYTGNGFIEESISLRGSGSGTTGYGWLGGTAKQTRYLDENDSSTISRGDFYQVIVDARSEPTSTSIVVNRDSGAGYAQLISVPNVYTAAQAKGFTQAAVPPYWQISLTGSTGGGTNTHEISALRVCAQTVVPPTGGVANEFNAIDEAYGFPSAVQNYLSGHIYQKVVGQPFKLNVAALSSNQIQTNYVVSGTKAVTLKLVDNSDGVCVLDSTKANHCSAACKAKIAVAGGQQTLTFATSDSGQKQSADFTINTAYSSLVAVISDSSAGDCSTDTFSVRPTGISSVISANATNGAISGSPVFKAGADPFSLALTTVGVASVASGYTGIAKVNSAALVPVLPATVAGSVSGSFPAATSATGASTATGASFTYSEVGGFVLSGYSPTVDATSPRGVYDDSWASVDSATTQNDCVQGSYSNTKDASGKYGCNFGLLANTATIGRFIPHHFALTPGTAVPACGGAFTYFGQDGFTTPFTLTAQNSGNGTTQNYAGTLAKLGLTAWGGTTASAASPGFGFATSATLPAGSTFAASATAPTGAWSAGVASVSAKHQIGRPTALAGETAVTVTALPVDSDGVTMPAAVAVQSASTPLRYGRLALFNAFGSERSALQLPMQLQYWSGKSWVVNSADTCTAITAPNFAFTFPAVDANNQLAACKTALSVSGSAPSYTLSLAAPGNGNYGWATVALNLGVAASGNRCVAVGGAGAAAMTVNAPWLQYSWGGSFGNPSARATFGVYSPETRKSVHVRELF